MKLHLPKQLFTALLAAITFMAPAAMTFGSSAWGVDDLGIVRENNFWANDYTYSFILNEDAFDNVTAVDGIQTVVISTYYGTKQTDNLYSNALIALRDESTGVITLKLGRGNYVNDNSYTMSNDAVTFSGVDIETGVVYTLNVTGANQAMTPTLYGIAAGQSDKKTSSYKGNMHGDAAMNSDLKSSATLVSKNVFTAADDTTTTNIVEGSAALEKTDTLVWAGTPEPESSAADWTSTSWNNISGTANGVAAGASSDVIFDASSNTAKTVNLSGDCAVNSMVVYDNYTFAVASGLSASLSTTAGMTIASGKNVTFSGSGALTLAGVVTNNGTLSVTDATLNISGDLLLGVGATTINNNGGDITISGALSVADGSKLSVYGGYSNAETGNGILEGGFYIVKSESDGTLDIGEGFSLQYEGETISSTGDGTTYKYDKEGGYLAVLLPRDASTYWINTSDSVYDNEDDDMLSATTIAVNNGGSLLLTDAGLLSKVSLYGETGKVYLTDLSSEHKVLEFTGNSGTAGLELSVTQPDINKNEFLVTTGTSASNYEGNIIILEGTTLKLNSDASADTATAGKSCMDNDNRYIAVHKGGTLDINGREAYYHLILNEGATIKNSGSDVNTSWKGLPYLELTGDATINAGARIVMQKGGSDSSGTFKLALNGHKLTKEGTDEFYLRGVTIGAGSLQIDNGRFVVANDVAADSGFKIILNGSNSILETDANFAFDNLEIILANEVYTDGGSMTINKGVSVASNATLKKTGSKELILKGTLDIQGLLQVNNGIVTVNANQQSIKNAKVSAAGGTLKLANKDAISYNSDGSINVTSGKLTLAERQTVDSGNKITLTGGTINGEGGIYDDTSGHYLDVAGAALKVGLDIYDESTMQITSTGTSSISANIGVRKQNGNIEFNVTSGSLTNSGVVTGNGGLKKAGSGELILSGANTYRNGTIIANGTVTTSNANALSSGGVTMTGGELKVTDVADTETDLTLQGMLEMNATASAKLATAGTTLNLGTTGSVKKVNSDSTQHVTIASDGTNAASMTAKSENAQLIQMQQDASFTIQDMTLTNTSISAASTNDKVNLKNIEASNVTLAKGAFTLAESPSSNVGAGGTRELTFTYGLGLGSTDASLTLNLDVVNAVAGDQHGTYTLVVELTNFNYEAFANVSVDAWGKYVGFQEGSGLAEALSQPAALTEGGSAPSVSYGFSGGGNVGTLVITITGLNVPEPATSTLSLLALAGLCARRRRKK